MKGCEVSGVKRYGVCIATSLSHTVKMILRKKQVIFMGCVALAPILIPISMTYLSGASGDANGNLVFVRIVEGVYIKVLAILAALFFGCLLIGEEVESQTMPYVLTRPIPRSAWILGKFSAYLILSSLILIPSMALVFLACTSLGEFTIAWPNIKLFLHYAIVIIAALMGYGSVCLLLGALLKRPVMAGLVIFFGWQRLAMYVPGLLDFLTIEKYVNALLPKLPTERENIVIRTALLEFEKKEYLISASKSAVALLVIVMLLIVATTIIVRWYEYSSAKALKV